jgi:hypothetical protein
MQFIIQKYSMYGMQGPDCLDIHDWIQNLKKNAAQCTLFDEWTEKWLEAKKQSWYTGNVMTIFFSWTSILLTCA